MATLVSGINNLAIAIRNKINLMVPRLLPGGGTTGQVLSKQSLTDYDSDWITLGTTAQRNIGTSGNTVPLLSYANTWSEAQQLSKGLLIGSPDLNLEVFADTTNGLLAIQGKNDTLGAMMPLKIAGSLVNITGNTTVFGSLLSTNLSGINTGDQTITLTGDLTGTGTGSFATTLKTVNSNVGVFGSVTSVPVLTVNAKGLVTAVSTATLGTAAQKNTGTSGNNVALLDGANSWSTHQTFNGNITVSGATTLNYGLTVNRPAGGDNIVAIGNPGVGFGSGFNFPKASDNAGMVVTETATDRTVYEFWMSDNPDGGDYFQWRWSDYQGVNGLFVPLRIGDLQNTFTGSIHNFYGNITQQSSTTGFFTTGDITGTIAALRTTPYWNNVSKLPVVTLQGTVAITALNVSGYTGNNGYAMWIAATSETTFNWGYGPFTPTPTPQQTGLSFVAGQVTLANGVKVTFNSASGAVAGDTWQCRVYKPSLNTFGRTTFTDQILSTTTALAPLVASTVLVTNLNADILDGQQGAYYLNATNFNAGTLLAARLPARTGDVTSPAGSDAYTLATVNANVGNFGSVAAVPVITVNAKGLITAVSTAALGTAAAFNVGTNGAFVAALNNANTWSASQTFSAKAIFATSTTTAASITLPHGVAPTTPTNGDMWTTSSSVFARINAVTKTLAFTDSSITGSAATLSTGRTIAISGDLVWTSPDFNGSANVTAAGVLATVNANVGTFGSASAVPAITVNAKGLVTAVSTIPLGSAAQKDTGTSGNVVALLDGANTWSATQNFSDTNLVSATVSGAVSAGSFTRGTYAVFDEGNLSFGNGLIVEDGVVAVAANSEPAFLSRFIATSGQTFTMAKTVSSADSIIVTQNGQRLDPTLDYSVSGVTLTLLSTVMPDDVIIAERSGGSIGPQGPAGTSAGANALDGFFAGTPSANQVIAGSIAPYSMTLNGMNSFAKCVTGPTATTTLIIKANNIQIGTIAFTTGATVGLVSYTTPGIGKSDLVTIVAPANAYSIANIAFELSE
jgi:hypothetical protein